MKRITCRDLGEKLGISHSTVSRALRNHPSVPLKTRQRVQALAAEIGYRPDPALGALNAYRLANQPPHYQATLAWVNPYPKSMGQQMPQFLAGGTYRAAELGFKIEPFWVPEAADWSRLAKTLKTRGIQGFVMTGCPPVLYPDLNPNDPQTWPWRDFPWDDFSAIGVGRGGFSMLHVVANNYVQSAALAVSKLAALGYRKIGIVLHSLEDQTSHFHWLAGYLAECARLGIAPLYLMDPEPLDRGSNPGPNFTKHAAQWLLRYRPEAVIAPDYGELQVMLRETRLKKPDDVAMASLLIYNRTKTPEFAGIFQNISLIGEAAVTHLADLIRRNERGMPASPMRYFVNGTWIDSPSAPSVRKPQSS